MQVLIMFSLACRNVCKHVIKSEFQKHLTFCQISGSLLCQLINQSPYIGSGTTGFIIFSTNDRTNPVTPYWICNNNNANRDGSDNAAIEAVSLDASYRVERLPSMGRYDLSIRNTTYDRSVFINILFT